MTPDHDVIWARYQIVGHLSSAVIYYPMIQYQRSTCSSMDRALDFGSRGCGFKSCRVRSCQKLSKESPHTYVVPQNVPETERNLHQFAYPPGMRLPCKEAVVYNPNE